MQRDDSMLHIFSSEMLLRGPSMCHVLTLLYSLKKSVTFLFCRCRFTQHVYIQPYKHFQDPKHQNIEFIDSYIEKGGVRLKERRENVFVKFWSSFERKWIRYWEVVYTGKCTVQLVVLWYTEKFGAFSTVHQFLKLYIARKIINLRSLFS